MTLTGYKLWWLASWILWVLLGPLNLQQSKHTRHWSEEGWLQTDDWLRFIPDQPGFIWWHKVAFQFISFGARHVGLGACIYPSWKSKAICLTSGSQCKSKGSLGLMKVFNISPTYLQWNSLVHMYLVWFIYYYNHNFYHYYYYSLLNIMHYVFLLFLNPYWVIPFRHYHWQAGFNLLTINISL